VDVGVELYYEGEIDSARSILLPVAEKARQAADTVVWARALTWLGLTARRQGDFPKARRLGEQALGLKLAADLSDQLYRSYNALGIIAWQETRLAEAEELFRKALTAARAVGDEKGVAGASGNLGLVHTDLGEFAEARRDFATLRDAGRALGSPLHEANGLTNLGMLDILVGAPLAAIPNLEEARGLYRSEGLGNEEVAVRQLGDAYAALGELGLAHANYDTALAMARAQGDRQAEAANLEVLAGLYPERSSSTRKLRRSTASSVCCGRPAGIYAAPR
jgi:tetratricopeptide (TPR) repeat protein